MCGKELEYLKNSTKTICYYCAEIFDANVKCIAGHFVCDGCHSLSANDLIERFCIGTKIEDPMEIALILMRSSGLKMHGPEHHFLVPAALVAACCNLKKDYREKEKKIREARKRSALIPGGFCGSHGNCGAGVGSGIYISLMTGATPLSEQEWKLSNNMTATSLLSIANHGGPRCCKRNTFLALIEAINFSNENFSSIAMNAVKTVRCEFSELNKECLKSKCPFYPA